MASRTVEFDDVMRLPAIRDFRILMGADDDYRNDPRYPAMHEAAARQLRAVHDVPPRSSRAADVLDTLSLASESARLQIARNHALIASVAERFGLKHRLEGWGYTPRDGPVTEADWLVIDTATVLALLVLLVVVVVVYIWVNAQPFWNAPCPVGLNGLVCSGNGPCTLSGYCDCDVAVFSGAACDVTACLGYDALTGTTCGGTLLGLCSPFMSPADVFPECLQITPNPGNDFAAPTGGWDFPACTARLASVRAALAASTLGGDITSQQLASLGAAGLPTCMCSGALDGDACDVTACPRNSDLEVCSGNGNTSVGLFANNTDVGNGCQCAPGSVFSFLGTDVAELLSPYAVATIRDRDLAFFAQPICGRLVCTVGPPDPVTGQASTTCIIFKGALLQTSSPSLVCYCDAAHYGVGCELGTCPSDPSGRVCSGNGHLSYGEGVLRNTSQSTNRNEACQVQCALGTIPCAPSTSVATALPPTQQPTSCDPDGGLLFSASQLCAVTEVAPTAGPAGAAGAAAGAPAKWRCGDGTLVAGPLAASVALNSDCDFGYVYGTLDASWFASARVTASCDMATADYARCFQAGDARLVAVNTTWGTTVNVTVASNVTYTNPALVPLGWFYLVASALVPSPSAPLANATVTVTYADLVLTFAVPLDGSRTTLAAALNVSMARLDLDAFANFTGQVPGTVAASPPGAATLAPYVDRYVLTNVPLLDVVPAQWSDFRLASATVPNAYVRVIAQGLSPLYANATVGYAGYGLLVTVPITAVLATDGTPLGWTTCLSQPSLCAWTIYNNGTIVSPLTGQLACWTGGVAWSVVTPPLACTPAFAGQNLQALGMTLVVHQRTPLPPSVAAPFAPGAWTVQLNVTVPPPYPLAINASVPLVWERAEFVGHDLLQIPCACPPPGPVGPGPRMINRTVQDTTWGTAVDGGMFSFSPQATAVSPLTLHGQPLWRRGVVLGGDATTTQISLRGFGIGNIPTSQLRAISATQFRSGWDDAPLGAYAGRCPTGYSATTRLIVTPIVETCTCVVAFVGAGVGTGTAQCACDPQAQCSCGVGLSASATQCECGAVDDADFEDALGAALGAVVAACECFALPPAVGLYGALATTAPGASPTAPGAATLTIAGAADASAVLLSFTSPSCFPITGLVAHDARFNTNTSVAFETVCGTLEAATSFEVFVGGGVGVGLGAEGVAATSWFVTADVNATAIFLTAHWSPGGVPVANVTWDASSSLAGAPPINASMFDATYWASALQFSAAPVWLRATFAQPSPVRRVVVAVRSAAAGSTSVTIPVLLTVEASLWGQPGVWSLVGSFVSNATGRPGADLDRHTITVPPALANATVLWGAVRIRSAFAFAVRVMQPLTDQQCSCAAAAAAPPQVFVDAPSPAIDTESLYTDVVAWTTTQNASVPLAQCVCENACLVQTPTAGVVDVANDGVCQDSGAVGAAGCALGMDCADCGTSRRNVGPAYNTSNAVGVPCTLGPLQQALLAGNASAVQQWRPVRDFGLAFVYALRVPRAAITFSLACDPALCAPFTARCPDGSCQPARPETVGADGVGGQSACTGNLYDCPGNGCLAADVNTRQYSCACRTGVWGSACQVEAAVPFDTFGTSGADPYSGITQQGPGHLAEQAPFNALVNILNVDDAEVLRLNRLWQPRSAIPGDVMNLRVKAWNGYGKIVVRTVVLESGDTIRTTCPYCRISTVGRTVCLEDDVETRSLVFPFWVTQFVSYPAGPLGPAMTPFWATETSYDELPVRAANGQCVDTLATAALVVKTNPVCSGNGVSFPWGVCVCTTGSTTFFITSKFTASTVPYNTDPVTGESTPGTWNAQVNYNWRDYAGVCLARDCAVTDCSAPMGCFAGSVENNFVDALVACTDPQTLMVGKTPAVAVSRAGLCAVNLQQCTAGNTFPQVPCSGHGLPRQRAYRVPDEEYCECGDPVSVSAVDFSQGIRASTQLVKNGWGGPRCDQYTCGDTSGLLQFSTRDPLTGLAYVDLGVPIPGVWVGYCGAPIGANPVDVAAGVWEPCCTELRLERCTSIPCTLGGVTVCAAPQACLNQGGAPLVYACNGQGTALADGTCQCTVDAAASTGYTANSTVYDHPNCFGTISCPISPTCTNACCRVAANVPAYWLYPAADPFFDSQAESQLALQGDGISNQTYVTQAAPNLVQQSFVVYEAALEQGLDYGTANAEAATCICVSPGENPAHPVCMVSYANPVDFANVAPYLKSYASPYELPLASAALAGYANSVVYGIVTNNQVSTSTVRRVNGVNYLAFPASSPTTATPPELDVVFNRTDTLVIVRVHALLTSLPTTFTFVDAQNLSTCASTTITTVNQNATWQWFTLFCTPAYANFDFAFNYPAAYIAECTAVGSTPVGCAAWQKATCVATGNVYNDPSALNQFRGCNSACCVLLGSFETTPQSYVRMVVASAQPVWTDAVRFEGYANSTTTPVPLRLAQEIACRTGTASDQAACAANPDILFWNAVFDSGVGGAGNTGYYVPGDAVDPTCGLPSFNSSQPQLTYSQALAACRATGGWLAATNLAVQSPLSAFEAIAEAIATANAAVPTPAYTQTYVALTDTNAILDPVVTDYMLDACTNPTSGQCRVRPSSNPTGLGYYATTNPSFYSVTQPTTPLGQLAWVPSPSPVSFFEAYMDPATHTTAIPGTGGGTYTTAGNFGSFVIFYNDPSCVTTARTELVTVTAAYQYTRIPFWSSTYGQGEYDLVQIGTPSLVPSSWAPTSPPSPLAQGMQLWGDFATVVVSCSPTTPTVCPSAYPQVLSSSTVPTPGGWGSTVTLFQTTPPPVTTPSPWPTVICVPLPGSGAGFTYAVTPYLSVPWQEAFIQTEVPSAGGPTPAPVPTPYPAQSYTLGWATQSYMPMGLIMYYTRLIAAFNGALFLNGAFYCDAFFGTALQTFPIQYAFGGNAPSHCPSTVATFYYVDATTPYGTNGIYNTYSPSSPTPSPGKMNFVTPVVATNNGLLPPLQFVTTIPACDTCQYYFPSTQWGWDLRSVPPGFVWPGQATGGSVPPFSQVVLYNMGSAFAASGIAGAVNLADLATNVPYWGYFAKQTVSIAMSNYRQPGNAGGWTRFDVGVLADIVPASSAVLQGYPHEASAQYACQFDTTQYVAEPGRNGPWCGPSSRSGGLAQPGLTCTAEFPAANATLNPLGAAAYAAYLNGTLASVLQMTGQNYDAARAFLNLSPGTWWTFPDAYARWVAGFSSQPGATSLGVAPDPYNWVNYALSEIWPVDCGHQVSVATGRITRRVASALAYCDPDAPQPLPVEFNLTQLPTVLFPLAPGTNPAFVSSCGYAVRPAAFYTQTPEGGPTPGYSQLFVITTATPEELVVSALASTFSIYNTGKVLPSLYQFRANSTVAGFVEIECAACTEVPVVTVWVSVINTQFLYPDNVTFPIVVLGSFSVEPGVGAVAYSFTAASLPATTPLYGPGAGPPFQVVGWGFAGLATGATVTLGNGIITDPLAVLQCMGFRGQLPKFGPLASVDSTAPDNQCVLDVVNMNYYGLTALGECYCDPLGGYDGEDCAAPVINTRFGREVCGGFGDGGVSAVSPAGTVVPTGTAQTDAEGVYVWTDPATGVKRTGCSAIDSGLVMWTRLAVTAAFSTPGFYAEINTFDQTEYVNATVNLQPLMPYSIAQSIAAGAAAEIASFVTADEVQQYLGLAPPNMLPLFLDISQNDLDTNGNFDFVWTTRSFPVYPPSQHCTSAATCGTVLATPVSGCATPDPVLPPYLPTTWTVGLCAALNWNNLIYLDGSMPHGSVDGDFSPVPMLGVVSGTILMPTFAQLVLVYIWSSFVGLSLASPLGGGACSAAAPRNNTLQLDVFLCDGTGDPSAPTALFYATPTMTTQLWEIQVFLENDRNRVLVYPYGG